MVYWKISNTQQNNKGETDKKDRRHGNINGKLADINPTLEIVALKVNILNIPIKNQRLTDGFFKYTVFIFQLYVVYKRYTLKDTSR